LKKELGKGQSSYQIPELFSKLELIAPANRITLKPSSVDFKWEGKPENSYEVRYSTSWDFSEYQTAYVYNKQGNDEYVKMVAVPAFLILILLNIRKRHLLLFLLTFVLFTGSQCEKDEIQTSDTISFSKTINNLEPQTIYYWKIVAQPETNNNFRSETIVYQFKTG